MSDPRLNAHNMHEAIDAMLKALKEGRLVARNIDGEPLPASYWKDKTVTSPLSADHTFRGVYFDPEEVKRLWPKD